MQKSFFILKLILKFFNKSCKTASIFYKMPCYWLKNCMKPLLKCFRKPIEDRYREKQQASNFIENYGNNIQDICADTNVIREKIEKDLEAESNELKYDKNSDKEINEFSQETTKNVLIEFSLENKENIMGSFQDPKHQECDKKSLRASVGSIKIKRIPGVESLENIVVEGITARNYIISSLHNTERNPEFYKSKLNTNKNNCLKSIVQEKKLLVESSGNNGNDINKSGLKDISYRNDDSSLDLFDRATLSYNTGGDHIK